MPGRPNLYRTTSDFLDYFGLSSISDLPDIDSKTLSQDGDLYTSIYKDEK